MRAGNWLTRIAVVMLAAVLMLQVIDATAYADRGYRRGHHRSYSRSHHPRSYCTMRYAPRPVYSRVYYYPVPYSYAPVYHCDPGHYYDPGVNVYYRSGGIRFYFRW